MKASTAIRGRALLVLLAPFAAGCVSQAGYRQAIADREAEIRDLRDERTALKGQVQSLKSQLDQARVELTAAGSQPASQPVEARHERIPALDELGVEYFERDGKMVISIPSSITFGSGSATLSQDGQKALRVVADTLRKQYPSGWYFIEGHTDTDPIQKSKFASNRELSLARAMAVLTYLVEECSIPDGRCAVSGYGEYRPAMAGDGAAQKARNRRVEIVVQT